VQPRQGKNERKPAVYTSINEDFERIFNAASASAVVFQRFLRSIRWPCYFLWHNANPFWPSSLCSLWLLLSRPAIDTSTGSKKKVNFQVFFETKNTFLTRIHFRKMNGMSLKKYIEQRKQGVPNGARPHGFGASNTDAASFIDMKRRDEFRQRFMLRSHSRRSWRRKNHSLHSTPRGHDVMRSKRSWKTVI